MSYSTQDQWMPTGAKDSPSAAPGCVGAGSRPAAALGLQPAAKPRPPTRPTADGRIIQPGQSKPWRPSQDQARPRGGRARAPALTDLTA